MEDMWGAHYLERAPGFDPFISNAKAMPMAISSPPPSPLWGSYTTFVSVRYLLEALSEQKLEYFSRLAQDTEDCRLVVSKHKSKKCLSEHLYSSKQTVLFI